MTNVTEHFQKVYQKYKLFFCPSFDSHQIFSIDIFTLYTNIFTSLFPLLEKIQNL